MNALAAIQALNALLALSSNGWLMALRIGPVIQKSIEEGKDIPDAEWDAIIAEADAADARLADVIRRKASG